MSSLLFPVLEAFEMLGKSKTESEFVMVPGNNKNGSTTPEKMPNKLRAFSSFIPYRMSMSGINTDSALLRTAMQSRLVVSGTDRERSGFQFVFAFRICRIECSLFR